MDYEKKYKEAVNKIKNLLDDGEKNGFTIVTYKTDLESIFPELKKSENELTWLKKYIEEEAYSLSIDIRDNEDHIKLKNLRKALAWLEKVITPNHNDIDSSFIEDIKNVINEAPLLMQSDKEKMISWLEKQGECHISHDDEIMIKQLTEYFTTGHGLQNTNETVVEWLNDVKEKLEKQDEVVSDKDDIEVEEKGIREAFNKIEDEKQCKQKPQRMISAEAKEAMYNKPADTVEPKCEESKTKIFDAPTPFEDKLYAFVAACEFLAIPSKIEFILEHSQEILDAAKEQIGKEQSSTWSEEDEKIFNKIIRKLDESDNVSHYDYADFEMWLIDLKEKLINI